MHAQCSKYQEQPQLLDPHLEALLAPLTGVLRTAARAAAAGGSPDLAAAQRAARLLQLLASLRGYKARRAPCTTKLAAHLPPFCPPLARRRWSSSFRMKQRTLSLPSRCCASPPHRAARRARTPTTRAHGRRALLNPPLALKLQSLTLRPDQTRSVLLLWLQILVLIPFALATVDSSLAGGAAEKGTTPPVALELLSLCRGFLAEPGIVRDVAAAAMARLLTRPDMAAALAEFLTWCRGALAAEDGPGATFLVPGAAAALAGVLKRGARRALAPAAPALWGDVAALASAPSAARSPLLRKRAAQLAQRAALLLLPPRPRAWRHTRATASLHRNLAPAPAPAAPSLSQPLRDDDDDDDDSAVESDEVAEAVEAAFELLLGALRDSDTVVRWAAAKGVGRLAARLPPALADEVLTAVLELFAPTQPDGAWHGGCLALAELARRGALLPARLAGAAPAVAAALRYDVRRGPHSVGAHVRDAAAYVAWAAARAYAPEDLGPALAAPLAPPLLTLACYDREVNCRRAAAAAFQELAGRLGGSADAHAPRAIEAVALADYFSVGPREGAYLRVAPAVAALAPSYRTHMAKHLLDAKLVHWDAAVRSLAARGMAALLPLDAAWGIEVALPALLPRTLAAEPGARHGALLALAAALPALTLDAAMSARIAAAVPALEKARLYRGKGGEMVRAAAATLVAAVADARLPLPPTQLAALLASADESLRHPSAEVQAAAAAAAAALVRGYCPGAAGAAQARRHAATLATDANPAARRGAALALAAMPREALAPAWRAVAAAAVMASMPEADVAARDAETRVNAVTALGALLDAAGVASDAGDDVATEAAEATALANVAASAATPDDDNAAASGLPAAAVAGALLPALMRGLEDYCTDNRGDVGSWVREAAMRALPRAVCALATAAPRRAPDAPERAVAALLQQAGEKIDRVRATAADALSALLRDLPAAARAALPHADALAASFPPPPALAAFGVPAEAFPALAPLLALPSYRRALVAGLTVSVGGLGDSLSRTAGAALLGALGGAPALALAAARDVVSLLAAAPKLDRVALPALRTLELLYAHAPLSDPAGDAAAQAELHGAAAAAITAAARGSRDVVKLCAAAAALAQLAGLPPGTAARCDARRALVALLAGPFPRVRRAAAEALYLRLLDDTEPETEAAAEALAAARWDAPQEEVRAAAASIHEALRLGPLPTALTPEGAAAAATLAPRRREAVDEHDSYRSLVDAAGY